MASRLAFISTRIDPPKHGKLRHSSGIRWPVPLLTETLDLRADSWRSALCPCHAHAGPLPPLPFPLPPLPPLPPVPPVPPLPLPFFASLGFPCTCAGSSEPTSECTKCTSSPGRLAVPGLLVRLLRSRLCLRVCEKHHTGMTGMQRAEASLAFGARSRSTPLSMAICAFSLSSATAAAFRLTLPS